MTTWNLGTLALISADFGEQGFSNTLAFRATAHNWATERGSFCPDDLVTVVRPLVAIDPENDEQVAYLTAAFVEAWSAFVGTCVDFREKALQQALRSQLPPAQLPEPTGLGAVVEDASHVEYIHLGSGLWAYGTTDGPSQGFSFADIAAVRVLSEGVR